MLRPLALALLTATSLGLAQGPRQLKLPPATARLSEEFTQIGAVRELADGRVLIADPREERVVIVDLSTGAVKQVSRKGQGPKEYNSPGWLLPIAGDSTLLMDPFARRWLLFSGAEIVATLPPDEPIIKAVRGFARGADRLGNVWTLATNLPFDPNNPKPGTATRGPSDSDLVVRGNRATARVDTITRLRGAITRTTLVTNAEGKVSSVGMNRAPLSFPEEAVLFEDGWFAVARLGPYRVDWISPDGKVTRGRPLPFTPIKVTSAEKDAYFARVQSRRGPPQSRMPEPLRRDAEMLREMFPEEFPPFTSGLIAGGDGNLWLRHPPSMNFPEARYDVVDRKGRLIGVLGLGKEERIVTVSRKAVYIAWKDEDDIERLRRHPLPH